MKKQLFGILFLFSFTSVFSQHTARAKMGIKMGAALAKTKLDYPTQAGTPTLSTKVGFMFGCFLNYTISNNLVLQPALLYVRKGAKQNFQNNYNRPLKYNYIEIPCNLLYRSPQKKGAYFLGGGLSPAFKVASTSGPSNELKSFDLGINALAMYQFPLGFSVTLGYTYSLLNTSAVTTNLSKIQNKYFGITAGYEF